MYQPRCETYCSVNERCQIDNYVLQTNHGNPSCVCPVGRFGLRCGLKYDDCDSNPCLNNGTCLSTYDLSGEMPYICDCPVRFYGSQCQNEKASVRITLSMKNTSSILSAVVQLFDIAIPFSYAYHPKSASFSWMAITITYNHPDLFAPCLGVLKVYKDLVHPVYWIMYVLRQSMINITTSPRHCPRASSFSLTGEF